MMVQSHKVVHAAETAIMAVSLMLLTACIYSNAQSNAFNATPEWVSDINVEKINEPSGIVYHPIRGTLFLVGDEGTLAETTLDGNLLQEKDLIKDLEGITVNPTTGYLYLVVEGEETILEIDPESLSTRREFQINRNFEGELVLTQDGSGIEAITFLPSDEDGSPERLLVSNQYPPFLLEIYIPPMSELAASNSFEVSIQRILTTNGKTITGLYFDQINGIVFAISDMQDALYMVSPDGIFLDEISLQGRKQEGITLDQLGHLYIAQDSGEIFKYNWSQ